MNTLIHCCTHDGLQIALRSCKCSSACAPQLTCAVAVLGPMARVRLACLSCTQCRLYGARPALRGAPEQGAAAAHHTGRRQRARGWPQPRAQRAVQGRGAQVRARRATQHGARRRSKRARPCPAMLACSNGRLPTHLPACMVRALPCCVRRAHTSEAAMRRVVQQVAADEAAGRIGPWHEPEMPEPLMSQVCGRAGGMDATDMGHITRKFGKKPATRPGVS